MLGRSTLLQHVIVLVWLVAVATATPNLWSVHIDNGPAPPVADEPPFSRHASRDRALLKYQIPGIVGGYIGFVLILGCAILTFGRRMRRDAQSSKEIKAMEMVKPPNKNLDPSPISPAQSYKRRWGNLGKTSLNGGRKGTPRYNTPQVSTAAAFDDKVVEADKARQQAEMEKIYEAIMAHDVVAPKHLAVREQDLGSAVNRHSTSPHIQESTPYGSSLHQIDTHDYCYPPELAHLGDPVQALYPPYAPMPSDPASRTTSTIPTTSPVSSYNSRSPLFLQTNLPTNPRSGLNHTPQSSRDSPMQRIGRRTSSLRISTTPNDLQPVTRSTLNSAEVYSPVDSDASPSSPIYVRRPITPYPQGYIPRTDDGDSKPTSATDIIHSYSYRDENFDGPRGLPSTAPQRSYTTSLPPSAHNTLDPTIRTHTPVTANSSMRSLPLRTFSPASTALPNPTPTPTRTTFLSPRQDRLNHFQTHLSPGRTLHPNTNLPSARLRVAGMTTPYSAYMPFSPVTPVTPGLRTREDRRRQEREEERRVPCQEDDEVIPEAEMWGDAY